MLGDLCWKCACERGQGCKKLVMLKGNREIGVMSKLQDCPWCCVCAKDTTGLPASMYANRHGIFSTSHRGACPYGSQPGMHSCSSGCGPWMSRPSRTSLQVLMGVWGHARASAWLSAHLESFLKLNSSQPVLAIMWASRVSRQVCPNRMPVVCFVSHGGIHA